MISWCIESLTFFIDCILAPLIYCGAYDWVMMRLMTNQIEMTDIAGVFFLSTPFVGGFVLYRNIHYLLYIKSVFPLLFPKNTNLDSLKKLITLRPFYNHLKNIIKYFKK